MFCSLTPCTCTVHGPSHVFSSPTGQCLKSAKASNRGLVGNPPVGKCLNPPLAEFSGQRLDYLQGLIHMLFCPHLVIERHDAFALFVNHKCLQHNRKSDLGRSACQGAYLAVCGQRVVYQNGF